MTIGMVIDDSVLNDLINQAKMNPRLRMNLDLRNSSCDGSQRMLNAVEPGTELPIHRHNKSTQTAICLRGHYEELYYNDNGELVEVIDMVPGGNILNVPIGQWHSLRSLESGTVLFECMDGPFHPLDEDEIMKVNG